MEGWGGAVIVEHLSGSQLQRQGLDLRQHLQDAKPPLYAFNHTKGPGRIGERTELV